VGYEIRTYGDPVLKSQSLAIENIDDKLVRLTDAMLDIMYDAPGIGLAAPQIGVQKQLFVYDIGDGAEVLINPVVVESAGEWVYDEGCLSIPGLYVEMVRPKEILLKGINIDGEEVSVEADELLARLFQHELDHLNGVLMFERMTPDQRTEALAEYRRLTEALDDASGAREKIKSQEPKVIKLK
jgi:peptide deformylase